jgi:hypothetical protein
LAWKSSTNKVNWLKVSSSDIYHVLISRNIRKSSSQHAARIGILLHLPLARHPSPLKPQIKPANPAKK